MKFHNQNRYIVMCHPEPFASLRINSAKGLPRSAARCFASLSMTFPILVVKIHNPEGSSFTYETCHHISQLESRGPHIQKRSECSASSSSLAGGSRGFAAQTI